MLLLRSFMFVINSMALYFLVIIMPFKTLAPITYVSIFGLFIFPMLCSLFKNKLFFYFKHSYINIAKTGFILGSILLATGVVLMIPFAIIAKFYSNILALALFGSVGATIWLMILAVFSFVPVVAQKNLNAIDNILVSFKYVKKNYHKIFAVTYKTYVLSILILPAPWAIKNFVTNVKRMVETMGFEPTTF